jgi:hypothetical protein
MISRGKRRYLRQLAYRQAGIARLRAMQLETQKPGWQPSPQMKKILAILDPHGRILPYRP